MMAPMAPVARGAAMRRCPSAGDGRRRAAGRSGSADGSGAFCKRSSKQTRVGGVPPRRPHDPSPAPRCQPTGRRPADADARVRPVPVANRRTRRCATPHWTHVSCGGRHGRGADRGGAPPPRGAWTLGTMRRCWQCATAAVALRYKRPGHPPPMVRAKATAARTGAPAPARRARRHVPPVRRGTGVVPRRRPTGRRCGVAAAPPAPLAVWGPPPPTPAHRCRSMRHRRHGRRRTPAPPAVRRGVIAVGTDVRPRSVGQRGIPVAARSGRVVGRPPPTNPPMSLVRVDAPFARGGGSHSAARCPLARGVPPSGPWRQPPQTWRSRPAVDGMRALSPCGRRTAMDAAKRSHGVWRRRPRRRRFGAHASAVDSGGVGEEWRGRGVSRGKSGCARVARDVNEDERAMVPLFHGVGPPFIEHPHPGGRRGHPPPTC